jgi:ribulose-phosphate 3-epimerase
MIVSPSLLAADFGNINREMEMINRSDADMIHLDVMDGVFVPNISFGFSVIEAVAKVSEKPLDVHLMVVHPEKWIQKLSKLGVTYMNVHQEACVHLDREIYAIHEAGMKAAVTLNPSTPVSMLEDVIADLDMVLLMSVNPGFGGQKFIQNTLNKVGRLRRMIQESGSKALIEIDGGVNAVTAKQLADAGADILVAGSYVFGSPDPIGAIRELKKL